VPNPRHSENDEWETEDAQVTRPVGAVISVRFPGDLAERILAEAQRSGLATSAFIRAAVESYLDSRETVRMSLDWSASSADGPVTLYSGRSGLVRSGGHQPDVSELTVIQS
jgi:predicted DNA-binding protein